MLFVFVLQVNIMSVKFPCVCCQKRVKRKHKALLCTVCKKWAHISCATVYHSVNYDNETKSSKIGNVRNAFLLNYPTLVVKLQMVYQTHHFESVA